MELKDGDFMDLDFVFSNSKTLVIAIHGWEGSSNSSYILALAKLLYKNSIDVVAANLRGCSGEPNRLFSSYHSGKTEDLDEIITHINTTYDYEELFIVGYSLGGNIVLKYLGESHNQKSSKIKAAIAVSVTCDLSSSAKVLAKKSNIIYMNRFLRTLKSKAREKHSQFPEENLNIDSILKVKNFKDFDGLYTAPANGFKNAEDYWKKCSSKPFLKNITIPTLLINALDDPLLSPECFPYEQAENHNFFFLETPKYGGHVGFNKSFFAKKNTWLESRILNFIQTHQ